MTPVWTPGASCHYHPITYGSLLDGLVRKVTGKSASTLLLQEEISGPLGLDFWIGLPPEQDARVAPHFQLGQALTVEPGHRPAHRSGRRYRASVCLQVFLLS